MFSFSFIYFTLKSQIHYRCENTSLLKHFYCSNEYVIDQSKDVNVRFAKK